MIQYPEGLPRPLREDYGFTPTSGLIRTQMQSGRSRQRRQFASVPTSTPVSWLFDATQAQLFESWYEEVLQGGSQWFEMEFKTPQGIMPYRARFVEGYTGPTMVTVSHWRFRAVLELFERPILKGGWAVYLPKFILSMAVFDQAMNREWPVSKYQTYMGSVDTAVNEEWPEA